MYKGTTPTYRFTLPDEIDLSTATAVYVTFCRKDNTEIFTKTGNDLNIETNSVEVFLTQSETLSLPTGRVRIQLNWLFDDDGVTKRACSNILSITARDNLKNEEL